MFKDETLKIERDEDFKRFSKNVNEMLLEISDGGFKKLNVSKKEIN